MKELGIITIKGHIRDDILDENDINMLEFICPNPDCTKHPKDSILGLISIPIGKVQTPKIWAYKKIDDTHIDIYPSILILNDCHMGIPTRFELVNTRKELYTPNADKFIC